MISERTSLHSPTLRVRTSTCVRRVRVVAASRRCCFAIRRMCTVR